MHAEWPLALGRADDADDLASDPARVGTGVGHRRLASRELGVFIELGGVGVRSGDVAHAGVHGVVGLREGARCQGTRTRW